jgi:LuxR family maltose regulon positive regulatory protein
MDRLKDRAILNSAKLFIPPLPEDFVPRRHLQSRLNLIARRPLALVSAPAGYGKTTAISAWLEQSELYGAWLSLDESDNDFTLLLTYFLAAVRRKAPAFGAELEEMLERGAPPPVPTFIDHFYAELDALDRGVVLVLEGFHLIHSPEALKLIDEFMRHPHPGLHLVLISRHDPQLPLSTWRAHNQMVDIRSADLRFTLEETAAFLNATLDRVVDDKLAANLHASAEGWVAGLRLAALSLTYAKGDGEGYLLEPGATNQYIVEFLAEHVLADLPLQKQTFLIQTSILNRLSGPLCEAVLASPDAGFDGRTMLRELNRDNLFIAPLDGDQEWFRYHHLLGAFLESRLLREYSREEVSRLHMRASRWFAEAGLTEEAIRHAMLAGERDEAIELVATTRHLLLNQERFGRLLSICNLFPDEVVHASPELLLAKAWSIHTTRFDIGELRSLVEEIGVLLDDLDLDPSRALLLRAEHGILRGIPLYYGLDPSASLALCQRGLQVLPKEYYTARAIARTYFAGSLQMMGDLGGAYEAIRLGHQEDLAAPGKPRARNAGGGGFIYWMAADLTGLMQVGQYLLAFAPSIDTHITRAWGHYFLACAHYHQNNLAEARFHAEHAFATRLSKQGFFAVYTGFVLALIHQVSGNLEKAREVMAQTTTYAIALQSVPLIFAAQAFQIELDIQQGHAKQAAQWAERTIQTLQFSALPLFYAPQLTAPKALLAASHPANRELLADCLLELRTRMEATHNVRFLIEALALEAMLYDSQGNEGAALETLERSISLAEPSRFIRLYVDLGPQMKGLLDRLRARCSKTDYIRSILAAFPGEKPKANEKMVEQLTERELQILDLLARRFSNKEIAQELYIATGTVKRHTANIYQKFNVQSRREAVEAARQLGCVE